MGMGRIRCFIWKKLYVHEGTEAVKSLMCLRNEKLGHLQTREEIGRSHKWQGLWFLMGMYKSFYSREKHHYIFKRAP
jgi:hypothetical protein